MCTGTGRSTLVIRSTWTSTMTLPIGFGEFANNARFAVTSTCRMASTTRRVSIPLVHTELGRRATRLRVHRRIHFVRVTSDCVRLVTTATWLTRNRCGKKISVCTGFFFSSAASHTCRAPVRPRRMSFGDRDTCSAPRHGTWSVRASGFASRRQLVGHMGHRTAEHPTRTV